MFVNFAYQNWWKIFPHVNCGLITTHVAYNKYYIELKNDKICKFLNNYIITHIKRKHNTRRFAYYAYYAYNYCYS